MSDKSDCNWQIIIADDHPLFRHALKNCLQQNFRGAQILEAEDFASLTQLLTEHSQANILLLDLQMPGCEGFSALLYAISQYPQIPVMVVSAHSEPDIIRRSLDHGAAGFLPKSAELAEMTEALTTVIEGGLWQPADVSGGSGVSASEEAVATALSKLTQQQFRVASMVYQGLLNKQIAAELNITEATVKAHMTEIFRKLGLNSRTQVVLALGQLAVKPQSVEAFR
ncbi:response regulator transcription factor [Halioxenophilus sp. WMMB6]|uniref:response regulator transcription factor n=1 Tax=Halioxenophilus sp. WMMB6 TaxID=3073815 RepID=UPI00295F088B|nr:response regulator transcription factor [Halioxenophilus sp. WMMB6]